VEPLDNFWIGHMADSLALDIGVFGT